MADSESDQVYSATYRFDTVPSERIRHNYPSLSANSDNASDRLVHGYGTEACTRTRSDRLVYGHGILGNGSASSDRLVYDHGIRLTEIDIITRKENDPAIDKEIHLQGRQSRLAEWHQNILAAERAQKTQAAEWKSLLEEHGGLDNLRAALTERVNSVWRKHRKKMRLVGSPERCVGGSVLPRTLQKEVEECARLLSIGSAQCVNFINTDTVIKLYNLGRLRANARDKS